MPPNVNTTSPITETVQIIKPKQPPREIVWRNVTIFVVLHIGTLYGFYIMNWRTLLSLLFFGHASALGVTGGAHRLWAHKSYKAKLPVRIFLMLLQTMAIQNHIYEWSRDHRVHHKFSETDADPHNAKRGFFFSHMGWLLVRKHPDVKEKGKTIDMSDLLKDPVVVFQKRHYYIMTLLMGVVFPVMVPVLLWGENLWDSFFVVFVARYIVSLHGTWLVNSAAHMWGNRPYDKTINPRENKYVSYIAIGEGFHNYHHTFPWDYAASELKWYFNFTCFFIDTMAWLGLVYDRKHATSEMVQRRKERTGELS